MSFQVPSSFGGSCFINYKGLNIQFEDDCTLEMVPILTVLSSSLWGKYNEIRRDLVLKFSGTPRYYDPNSVAALFPYIGGIAPGTPFGGGNVPCNVNSINGDQLIILNSIIGKMPDMALGIAKGIMGKMEVWGLVQSGVAPTAANAYYTYNPSGGAYNFSQPAVPATSIEGLQEFSATLGALTGFNTFQAQETWDLSHELGLEPVVIQGRTRAFRFQSYRAMVKLKPADTTLAQILAVLGLQGSAAVPGAYESLITSGAGTPVALTIAGNSGVPNIVLGGASLMSASVLFSSKLLRQGEIGFVSSNTPGTSPITPLILS